MIQELITALEAESIWLTHTHTEWNKKRKFTRVVVNGNCFNSLLSELFKRVAYAIFR